MANHHQSEGGYTAIANEILDALCRIRIPGEERQILDAILRKTYGWKRQEDFISLPQFVEMTGINKPSVVRAIHGLLTKKIIIVNKRANICAKVYKINNDYDQWQPLSKKLTTKGNKKDRNTKKFSMPSISEVTAYCQ